MACNRWRNPTRHLLACAGLSLNLIACGGGGGGESSINRLNPAPTVNAQSASLQETWPGNPVTFKADCVGTGSRHYKWDFGDGSTEGSSSAFDKAEVSHTYTTSSDTVLTVTVQCTDDTGQSGVVRMSVHVGPEALATVAGLSCSGTGFAQGWCRQFPQNITPTITRAAALTAFTQFGISAGHLLKSVDGGVSWRAVPLPTTQRLNDLSAFQGNTAWAAGDGNAVIKTSDGGISWTAQNIEGNDTFGFKHIVSIDPQTAWITNGISTWRTTDGGQTWTMLDTIVPGSPITPRPEGGALTAFSRDIAWVGAGATIRRTTDGGAHWQSSTVGQGIFIESLSAASDKIVWAADANSVVYLSQDGGTSWAVSTSLPTSNVIARQINRVLATSADSAWLLGVVRASGGTDQPVLWFTNDRGAHWQAINGADTPSFFDLATLEGQVAWVYGSSSVYRLASGSLQKVASSSALPSGLSVIKAISDQIAWAAGDLGTVLRTNNGGRDWVDASIGSHVPIVSMSAVSATSAWALPMEQGLLKTTDGTTWSAPPAAPGSLMTIDALGADLVWGGGTGGKIVKTTDGGASWITQNTPGNAHVQLIKGVDAHTAWALGPNIQTPGVWFLLRTTDGLNWQTVSPPNPPPTGWHNISTPSKQVIWLLGESTPFSPIDTPVALLLSEDGGETWMQRQGPADARLRSITSTDARNLWVSGAQGLWRSRDGALSWQLQGLGGEGAVSVSAVNPQTLWAASRIGTIYKTITGGN